MQLFGGNEVFWLENGVELGLSSEMQAIQQQTIEANKNKHVNYLTYKRL
jgi:hypothetical protein